MIRNLDLGGIATLLEWAAGEGWNPGLNDAPAFQAADPNGFFGVFVDGAMAAGISAVCHDAHFGFIGLYICHPDWRGQGHGKAVWEAGMAYLGNRTIGLDGVPEQQANYASMGFAAAYDTVRMSGRLLATAAPLPAASLGLVRELEYQCFPASRDAFLTSWLTSPNQGMVHLAQGIVDAYAVLRPCRDGSKIGPLFAHNLDAAMDILATLSGPVHIDVPAAQTAWLAALTERGFTPSFCTRRMYRGTPPTLHMQSIFGISSLELG
ncbi:MAG: GCN5-related N-acetyltransferase [Devosia sp.]|uniref:GNAT family N-acetyltransferase n=1 Tax=Devosia sp. TaxID=1871048 RepID=UPI0026200FC1|nr:GNAT family N-acetyltransferase [Devosia sp.]MDB5585046.1 GCN5-related N-acetyltransferase [Devosia sp.]